ncbi:MAG: ImmA/IrrE family metallo-endopeptidase [Chlorobiales bacterium]|nr:ImmA/IrrE family metallo-endopeptidase [Chlorobiales bacterium]
MKKVTYIKVNHEVLKWARESIVLSRAKAAENTSISVKRLEQLEDGEKQPSLDELKALSKEYKRTIATLLLKQPPKEKPLPKDRRTVNSKELDHFHEKTIMAVRKARALATALIELKEETGQPLTQFQYKASFEDSPSLIAQELRAKWALDEVRQLGSMNDVLEAYIEKVESLGVAVFQLSLTQDNLRGFSIVDEQVPIIVIKKGGEQTTSKIFTLFHELGHLLLNEGGICDITFDTGAQKIEMWCNAFAAELLIPSKELLGMKLVKERKATKEKEWPKKELIELANYFHVGPLAILRCLLEHNLTTPAFYKEKHAAWNKPSFGRAKNPEGINIPKEAIKERGRNYIRLAFKAFDQNKIDLKDLSDFLGVKLSYIPKTRQLLNAS